MIEKIKQNFEKNKKIWIILIVIMAVGIFLRTYEFHDWLRFSRDQARDARIITDALDGKESLPLLGPKAAGTSFLLGPMYYYFSYASGTVFGNYPDKFAYPSLIFSILAIPLLFFFMREYFSRNISLISAAIMSVSYFFVVSSRFSSNPHLIPFFLLLNLIALLRIMDERSKNAALWSVLAGVGLGIGIQLHTVYIVVMPIIMVFVFARLFIKRVPETWKKMLVAVAMVLALNATQIYSEITTNWQNSKNFIAGFNEKSTKSNFSDNVRWVSACQIQANSHFLTSLRDKDTCSTILKPPSKKFEKNIAFYFKLLAYALFSLIGYILLVRAFRKENDQKRKNFLGLMALLNLIAFMIFLFVAKFLFVSYFVIILPIPFVLLGLMFESISKKFGKWGKISIAVLSILLITSGLVRNYQAAKDYKKGLGNNTESTTLEDIELISRYMLASSEGFDKLYLTGSKEIVGRFHSALQYFMQGAGKTMILSWELNNKIIEPGLPMFYIENNSKEIVIGKKKGNREIISGEIFFRQKVLILKN